MIIAVSTVKDSRENVEKFVRRNLLGGVDHLVIFLDDAMPDVEDLLDGHPHATAVRAYGDWWAGHRPDDLNERQVTNHGLASRVVAGSPWAEWMVVLDGDEVAQVDRSVLDGLDPGIRAVRLSPLEAVSRMHADGDPTSFKRRPTRDELLLLTTLGVIAEPRIRAYFRGHAFGKPGLRLAPGYAVGVHHAVATATGDRLEPVAHPGLRLLHYESHNRQEFVRKWRALLGSGVGVRQHRTRSPVAQSFSAVLDLGLDDTATQAVLDRLYRAAALDDAETLHRLGLLVEVDPDHGNRTPVSDPEGVVALRTVLDRAHDLPKPQFRPRGLDKSVDRTVAKLRRRL